MSDRATSDLARLVLDALPYTIYTVDLDGVITSVNRTWSRFARANGAPEIADPGSMTNRRIWDAISDTAERAQIERAMQQLRTGRADVVSWEFPCSSPTEDRIFLMQMVPLREEQTLTGFAFSTVDITTSHRAREALIDVGTALARTIELDRVLQDVSHEVRRAVPCDGLVIALAAAEQGELRIAHRVGEHDGADDEALARRLAPRWEQALDTAAVLEDPAPGRPGQVELTAPMLGADGALGAMTLLADAPESNQRRHEIERVLLTIGAQLAAAVQRAALVERVEEKRRLEAIGEVAAAMAHELRNPLFGISSAAQLLRFRAREDPVIERNVGRILREVERLNGMVTDLLEFGRPRPLQLEPGDPDAVWDEVLEGNRGLLEARALHLHRNRAALPAAGPQWRIDAERLRQVFLNILRNAVDHAPPTSELALASHVLPGGAWRCTLTNGGPPVPPDALPRVFELFFSTRQGGTGIGLALCQRIMDELGGSITLDSSAARGTTVTVTVPRAADAG